MKTTIMQKIFRSFAALIAGIVLSIGAVHAESGSTGKEFFFSFQPNFNSNGTLSLFVTGQTNTQGTVTVAGLNFSAPFTVLANKVTTVAVPAAAQRLPVNAISTLAVHVVAQDDVTIYGLNQQQFTTDAFLALPIDALGLEYFALSYVNNVGLPSQAVIVGAFDNTHVTITPALALSGHAAGVPFAVTLNRGDTYMVTSTADVSGTNIVADAPVAVMSGVECVDIPTGALFCDHIVEMMPPLSTWGKSFLTVPLATRLNGDVFRIIAAENGTTININGALVATLQRGKFFETVLKTRSQIEASAPVLVAQYSPGTTFDNVTSDPFMMLIPPTEQFLNQYTFSTPATGFSLNFVNVVAPSGETASLRLDGAPVDATKFSAIGTSGFSGAQLPISLGSHNLVSTSQVPFGIYVYGYASFDSYGYPGGMSFRAINPVGDPYPPNVRLVQVGDTIQGTATDSEDVNANGILDAGEDLNGNGQIDRRSEDINGNGKLDPGEDANGNNVLDRDTGIFRVELLPGSANLKLDVLPFVPGALAAQFSITRIDLTKPGTGILHIEDGAGNKTEAPVALGAVATLRNVRVIETLATAGIELDLASFAKPPFSITDGTSQKIIEWRFDTFNADSAADLGFDVVFKNPVPAERRLVSRQLDLFYDDVNGKPVHAGLGSRFVDVYPSIFEITPATDKASYGANETVQITSAMKNLSAFAASAGLKLSIVDSGNILVATLGTLPAQTVAAGATGIFTGLNFPTGNSYVGSYKVLAELIDNAGKVLATGSAPFAITAAGGPSVRAAINTDKQLYNPFEVVHISDRVTNLLSNLALADLRVITSVTNPDGSVRFTTTEILPQLAPNALKDYAYNLSLGSAGAGQYGATLTVTKADGTLLAQAGTQFTVASTADTGAGLVGTIAATPVLANTGQTIALTISATNRGNSALANVPLKVSIVEPATQQVIAEYPYTTTLAVGEAFLGSVNWVAVGSTGATYVAVLNTAIGGKTIILAQASFTVLKLDIKQTLSNGSRVLVLVSCNDDEPEIVGNDGKAPVCITNRTQTIEQTLSALGVMHTITTNETAFKLAFRSGLYNTYWISGKEDKLHDDLAGEIREAVFSGDGIILDGVHDQRNKTLDSVAGLNWRGKIGETELPVDISGPLFTAQTLGTIGRALKIELSGSAQQAAFHGTKPNSSGPAIISNTYGTGHALTFAFDLVSSLHAEAKWQPILAASLQAVLPAQSTTLTPEGLLSIKTSITNQGQATGVTVKIVLPAGASYLSLSPAATFDAATRTITWAFHLDVAQTQDLFLLLEAPATAGDTTLQTSVATVNNGSANPYGAALTLPIRVIAAAQSSAEAISALQSLPLSTVKDQKLRDALVTELREAMTSFNRNTVSGYQSTIGSLLDIVARLSDLGQVDTSQVRYAIDRILREAQIRWVDAQPPGNP